jgi:hypothetical protein
MSHVNLNNEFAYQLASMQRAAAKDGSTIRADYQRLTIYWVDPDGSIDVCWSPEIAMIVEFDDGSYQ